ncbi:MAG: cell division protein ZapB [Deltaproteobacteria bacterium]|nr:cell division protein ZapB [Deltaproteobacteria bacterium]
MPDYDKFNLLESKITGLLGNYGELQLANQQLQTKLSEQDQKIMEMNQELTRLREENAAVDRKVQSMLEMLDSLNMP